MILGNLKRKDPKNLQLLTQNIYPPDL